MTDVNYVLSMFNRNRETATKSFIEFINKPNDDTCLDIKENYRITDKDARIIIKNLCKIDHTTDLQKLDKPRPLVTRKQFRSLWSLGPG